MKFKKARRILLIYGGALAVLLAVAYAVFRTSSVRVDNDAAVQVSVIRVELGGKVFWEGSLAPGQSHRTFGVVPDDGYIVLVFKSDAEEHKRTFSSVTTLYPGHHKLTITPDLDVTCSSTSADCVDLTKRWGE
jgi:hypothetical protein